MPSLCSHREISTAALVKKFPLDQDCVNVYGNLFKSSFKKKPPCAQAKTPCES